MGDGARTAVELALAERGADAPAPAAEQLGLLPLRPAAVDGGAEPAPGRGRGRPAGSRNRRTEEWAEFILSRYRSPLVVLAETYSRPVEDLAQELGCTKLEAFERQQRAAVELAPYLHGKQPIAVDLNKRQVVNLTIVEAAPEAAAIEGTIVLEARLIESEQNQALGEGGDAPV